jgi:hypothetical protein
MRPMKIKQNVYMYNSKNNAVYPVIALKLTIKYTSAARVIMLTCSTDFELFSYSPEVCNEYIIRAISITEVQKHKLINEEHSL